MKPLGVLESIRCEGDRYEEYNGGKKQGICFSGRGIP